MQMPSWNLPYIRKSINSRYSIVNQLLSITHERFSSFDDNFEAGVVLLDISKAFDNLWHEEFIHKLKRNGTFRNLLSLLTDFLKK